MSGQDIVKKAFDELTPERQHDILQEIGIHYFPCDVCISREPHQHDWRGIDTGRMCAICLEKEEL